MSDLISKVTESFFFLSSTYTHGIQVLAETAKRNPDEYFFARCFSKLSLGVSQSYERPQRETGRSDKLICKYDRRLLILAEDKLANRRLNQIALSMENVFICITM